MLTTGVGVTLANCTAGARPNVRCADRVRSEADPAGFTRGDLLHKTLPQAGKCSWFQLPPLSGGKESRNLGRGFRKEDLHVILGEGISGETRKPI